MNRMMAGKCAIKAHVLILLLSASWNKQQVPELVNTGNRLSFVSFVEFCTVLTNTRPFHKPQ